MSTAVEQRTIKRPVQLRAGGRTIGGYAAVFGRRSDPIGDFVEQVDPRFFNKSRGDGWPGVVARYNHRDDYLLGTSAAGTLRLTVDATGLHYDVDLPRSRDDVHELVARGDVRSSSFAFHAYDEDWSYVNGTPLRTLLSGKLLDVAPVTNPAYPDATVGLRSLARFVDADFDDVIDLAKRHELRKLFERTDTAPAPVPAAAAVSVPAPRPGPTWQQAHLDRMEKIHEMRPLRATISGRQALLDTLEKRWVAYTPTPATKRAEPAQQLAPMAQRCPKAR